MRKLILSFFTLLAITAQADVKISQLPLGSAFNAGPNDSLPYVDSLASVTKRMKLYDLINLPPFASVGAPLTKLVGDVVTTSTGTATATIQPGVVTNAKLAVVPALSFKANSGTGTGTVTDITVTQATAMLNEMVGDSGSGGTKGLAPAPASGDAAAGKFLKADGTYAVPAGTFSAFTALTGDVVATGTGTATATIQPGVVTNSKLAVMAAQSIKGNTGTATGTAQDLTTAQVVSLVGIVQGVTGDIVATGTGTVTSTIQAGVVTNSKLAVMAAQSIKGNTGTATGTAQDLTTSQVHTLLADVTTVGALDGQSATSSGLAISGNTIYLQSADATHPGGVNTGTQTIAGVKTFSSAPNLSSLSASLPLQLDGSKNITALAIDLSTSEVTGTLSATHLPNPSASTLGGIESYVAVSHQWINAISTSGVPASTQPDFSDLSGTLSNTQISDGTITNAKLATRPARTLFGNTSTNTTTGTDLSISQVNTMLADVTTVGALDGQSATSSGLAISGNTVYLQSADATHPGGVNTGTQTFAGVKTFSSAPNLSSLSASQILQTDGSKNVTAAALTSAQMTISCTAVSAQDIDWSTSNCFTKTLGASSTYTFSNKTSGQTIVVRFTNTASNFTVTWPTVKWVAGSAPVMTTGVHSDVYTFFYDGSNVYGSAVQNF